MRLITLLFIAFAFTHIGSSQDDANFELKYEVNKIYPYISITKKQLNDAHTLIDINEHYKPSWIREYISVEILTNYDGRTKKAVSKNDTLTQEQKGIINMADVRADITVKVLYMPENTLAHNDIKEINFTLTVDPVNEAQYPGGQLKLKQYLKENAIDKISDNNIRRYNLVAVKFAINKEGQVVDVHVFETSKDEEMDELLLETICNMPKWKPAEYSNGIKIEQEFVLTVGDMESCVLGLLNIRQD